MFGIKHKANGMWFGGFGQNDQPTWVSEGAAWRASRLAAECQAMFLASMDRLVQKKPVALA